MRGAARFLAAMAIVGAHTAVAADGVYPDWIRMKDSSAVRCRILSDNDGVVEAVMAGSQGGERVTIDRTQIEWLQRNSTPRPVQEGARGDAFRPRRRF